MKISNFSSIDKKIELREYVHNAEIRIAIVLHGSGSCGSWYKEFQKLIDDESLGISLEPLSYGPIFPPSVLLFAKRKTELALIGEQLKKIIRDNQSIDTLSIIAHSYGTYLISLCLANNAAKFRHIFLMGNICKWSDLHNMEQSADEIYNDVATKDWIPIVAQVIRPRTYEASGTYGVRGPSIIKNRFFTGGHHQHVNIEHIKKNIIPILNGDQIPQGELSEPYFSDRIFYLIQVSKYIPVFIVIGIFICLYIYYS